MKEADVVKKIIFEMKKWVPRALVFKINDLRTKGIPDICVNYRKKTTWIEAKFFKENETMATVKKHIDSLQLATCRRLENESHCYYFITYPWCGTTRAAILRPRAVAQLLEFPEYHHSLLSISSIHDQTLRECIDKMVEIVKNGN